MLPEKSANEQRPKSLSALEDLNKHGDHLQSSFCAIYNMKGAHSTTNTHKTSPNPEKSVSLSLISGTSPTPSYKLIENTEQLSLTDLSLSEVIPNSSTENLNTSQSSISFPISPSKNSLSPNVSPMLFCDGMKTLSQDILTSLSPSVASLLESKTQNSSESSLIDDNKSNASVCSNEEIENIARLRSDVREGNLEYLKLTDNNISSNEEDVSPIRFPKGAQKLDFLTDSLEFCSNNLKGINKEEIHEVQLSSEDNIKNNQEMGRMEERKEVPLNHISSKNLNSIEENMDQRPVNLNLEDQRPISVNLIEFSPSEPTVEGSSRINMNDKRKSCETESLDDENSIYQQVKYFRRSIHEINALLDLKDDVPPQPEDQNISVDVANIKHMNREDAILDKDSEVETFDSLETDNEQHIYENVENPIQENINVNISLEQPKPIDEQVPKDLPEKPNVRSLTNHFELKETSQKPPIFKRNDYENVGLRSQKPPIMLGIVKENEKKCGARDSVRTSKSDFGSSSSIESDRVQKIVYDRGSLPPCLRARHVKNAIKTRSLDEDAFAKEFGVAQPMERRKSMDENFGSKLNTLPKVLNQPKPIPMEGQKLDLHLAHSTDNISLGLPEQKLNRERIEKYKEERRKFLHDKYRSESFKEDKDILLSRFKQKTVKCKIGEGEGVSKTEPKEGRIYSSDPGPCSELSKLGTRKKYGESESKQIKAEANLNEFAKDSLECDNTINQSNKNESKISNIEKLSTCQSNKTKNAISESPNDFRESIRFKTALFESQVNQSKQFVDVKGCERNLGKSTDDSNKFNSKKVQEYKSPINTRKNISVKETESDILGNAVDSEFIRNRRRDEDSVKNERRRHTYESRERERESESDRVRRISLENRSPRKETKSPSYCIKDMKAIFESKSQQ
ncbi:hypothetical protein ILUMI_03773 [Ignelater luminosus]|uniref:Uncharacterized protein n=1 Tax=Ignelater luminosus TaxID=2038154 RepID=A0A8K0GJM1_IGNLU|nr:hypothetical protein ILUMI_03773 [Ignelater luminosus]